MRNVRIWSVVVALLAGVLLSDGARAQRVRPEAITRTPTQVEVTNFPVVQAVSGSVNVSNLPAVQTVVGGVQVTNLPLDANGNLRVSAQEPGGPASTTMELTLVEADRNRLARFPLIQLPTGYRFVTVWVVTLDDTRVRIPQYQVAFGSPSAPPVHTTLGDFQVFGASVADEGTVVGTYPNSGLATRYRITGSHLQLAVYSQSTDQQQPVIPPDAQYYVYLYLSQ